MKHPLLAAAACPWIDHDRAYQAHHFACPVCIAAGKGIGQRCAAGADLWGTYTDAMTRGVA